MPNSDGHIFLLHPEELFSLASKAGLTVESLTLFTNPLSVGHVKLKGMLRILPQSWVDRLESITSGSSSFLAPLNYHMMAVLRHDSH
jgi:2-polyprenyl-6-hydroxyphenyl methylase/3-demethylubiquinone-9 3-methyltransferase